MFATLRFQDRPLQAIAQKDGHPLLGNGKPASIVTLRADLMSCQLFFDDESRNREVESLGKWYDPAKSSTEVANSCIGVTFCLVKDETNERLLEKGLATWRGRHPEEANEDAADV
jgi:hypothetical protein